ncbi:piwi-like protein Siwi [Copidosoma floridanum]|uniref:piwi-like protein Siwi n=1 Tax=Copidosoma floridanum TaxID=29053 RepID=UPI0006C94145|nr:piwi-like protein Siwi [Copidosoma floridanum]
MQRPRDRLKVERHEICTRGVITSKQGKLGMPTTLEANYFKLSAHPDWTLNQYRVDIAPEVEHTGVKKGLLRVHKNELGAYLFDGTMLYTYHNLPQPLEFNSFREPDKQAVNIKIRLVSTVAQGDYHYLQVFNVIVRKCLEHLNLALVGRNYYDTEDGITIPRFRLKIWRGYVTSIRQHESGILLCSEISHKVMRTETILDVLMDCYRRNSRNYQKMFFDAVVGNIVITHYNNKTYRIHDVDFKVNPQSTFKKRDGTDIQYAEYYKERYNIEVKDRKQPLLVSRSSARDIRAGLAEFVYLIPEFCYSTGITDEMRQNFNLMRELIAQTRISPDVRVERLMSFHKRLNSKPAIKDDLQRWNLQLDNQLVKVPARVLPIQKVIFGNRIQVDTQNAEWDLHYKPKPMVASADLKEWIVFCTQELCTPTQKFLQEVVNIAAQMGFRMIRPSIKLIQNENPDTYANSISSVIANSNPQAIVCIVSNNNQVRYNAIKKKLCVDRAIPSQVISSRSLEHKSRRAVACKIAVQINCKLGGTPWIVDISETLVKGLMVVGFDVCHEKSIGSEDFGAMVSSLDKNFGRHFSAVTKQLPGEELSNCIANHLSTAVMEYRRNNNNELPSCIIIYRDGVGDGQIPFVHEYEVKQIQKKLEDVYKVANKKLRLAFVIVTKRINTRLFNKRQNPVPGTVVDDVITDPLKYDFFIVSQSVKQGTVSPTSYNVIADNTGLSPDHMQLITYRLCHMYYNFNGTVRVPSVCQYAHKLAMFMSQTLRQPANPNLQNLLYFL